METQTRYTDQAWHRFCDAMDAYHAAAKKRDQAIASKFAKLQAKIHADYFKAVSK